VSLPDEIDELLRLASQREQLERTRRKLLPDPFDRTDGDADLLMAIDHQLNRRFWQLAYQIGEAIGWNFEEPRTSNEER
jgi:hypothetical protein